jgi:acetolactate synthase I/II/III large subunit
MNEPMFLTGAKGIVECLKLEGVEKVFSVPGESFLPLIDAIYDEPSIQFVSARHEGGAAFMAEGYAKISGKPSVLMATRGVGAANASIGIHTAYQDSTPMVIFIGQVDSRFRGREGFQEIDFEKHFSEITKWGVEIHQVERIPELIQRAFRIAQTGRPGPVVISLPEDILEKSAWMAFHSPVIKPAPRPSLQEIKKLEKALKNAKRPLLIAGGGIKSAQAEDKLITFAEKFHLPVMVAFRRHDVFPHHHPLFTGHLGLGVHASILETVKQADLIFAIGTRLSEVTTQDYQLITPQQKLIHIDIDFAVLGKVYAPDIGIVADALEALNALMDIDLQPIWKDWAKERRKIYESIIHIPLDEHDFHKQIIASMLRILPKNVIITNDAGNFAGWLHQYYQFTEKNSYAGPTSGAMGYGMPAAIGAKLASPNQLVVSLSGDGGFMMTMAELETAVRLNIPIISLVFNNQMYGTIRMHQEMHFPYRVIGTDLGNVPFAEIAKSLGAEGYYISSPQEFEHALSSSLMTNKPVVIEIKSNAEQISVASTINQIRAKKGGEKNDE